VKAISWNEIEGVYLDLLRRGWEHERLLELVTHIKKSNYSDRIFGTTSLDKLILSIYDPIALTKESLHITFDRINKTWSFKYYAVPFKGVEFERTYPETKGIEKLDNFIKMIRW
jgi:hypothetical protein